MDVQLRPFTRDDVAILERFAVDPEAAGPYQWTGFRNRNRPMQRFDDNGLLGEDAAHLVVVSGDDAVGAVQWRPASYGGLIPGSAWTIGCALLPHARGRGLGTAAHQALTHYLFSTTAAIRIEADTDADNDAEHRCLERVGFVKEGVFRQAAFRDGRWRNVWRYALLREDYEVRSSP